MDDARNIVLLRMIRSISNFAVNITLILFLYSLLTFGEEI
jgi:hypothetical protein